jgi:HAMP domain-containing protein
MLAVLPLIAAGVLAACTGRRLDEREPCRQRVRGGDGGILSDAPAQDEIGGVPGVLGRAARLLIRASSRMNSLSAAS